jgi:hypothetical protein
VFDVISVVFGLESHKILWAVQLLLSTALGDTLPVTVGSTLIVPSGRIASLDVSLPCIIADLMRGPLKLSTEWVVWAPPAMAVVAMPKTSAAIAKTLGNICLLLNRET